MAKVVETAIDSVTLDTDEGVAAIVVEYPTLLEIAELVISLVVTGT